MLRRCIGRRRIQWCALKCFRNSPKIHRKKFSQYFICKQESKTKTPRNCHKLTCRQQRQPQKSCQSSSTSEWWSFSLVVLWLDKHWLVLGDQRSVCKFTDKPNNSGYICIYAGFFTSEPTLRVVEPWIWNFLIDIYFQVSNYASCKLIREKFHFTCELITYTSDVRICFCKIYSCILMQVKILQ